MRVGRANESGLHSGEVFRFHKKSPDCSCRNYFTECRNSTAEGSRATGLGCDQLLLYPRLHRPRPLGLCSAHPMGSASVIDGPRCECKQSAARLLCKSALREATTDHSTDPAGRTWIVPLHLKTKKTQLELVNSDTRCILRIMDSGEADLERHFVPHKNATLALGHHFAQGPIKAPALYWLAMIFTSSNHPS